jgi:hypothetical protein
MIAFELSMPRAASWNGRWSGEGRLHVKIRRLAKEQEERIAGKSYNYRWDDGWCARVSANKVDGKEAARLRKKSAGFFGYDWMIDSIIEHNEIRSE